ncbi:MAG: hypothetical protein CMO16_03700 [Thaumarchaeota archaeon]|nr:hypothetical protein [Nitrososphaerota archaeon]|tara:strand:- start:259 stop:1164 length:906 start_codon:yes stop_codon:yes gene_type:complete
MGDASGQAEIRGIDIDKLAKGFADEASILKKFVAVSKTTAREIRWYQKTSGFLDSTDTTGITLSQIANTSERSLPVVVEQSWTRQTSYVKKFFVESPTISEEDIKDSDVDILATNVRDLVRAVANQVDIRIYSVIIEAAAATPTTPNPTNTLTTAATADGWDDAVTGNPIKDIMTGNRKIRAQGYDTSSIVLYINPIEHENLLNYLINVKGSSIPSFSSEKVKTGVLMELLGNKVVVSQNATTDNALQFIPNRSATWKEFMPMKSVVITDAGIGRKIRVWSEGEAILTDPKSVHQITDTSV